MVHPAPTHRLKISHLSFQHFSISVFQYLPMKTPSHILILSLTLAGWAVADLPKKAPITKYYSLYTNSPFTSKPAVIDPAPPTSIIDDYALSGVSPVSGGYVVTLLNKKKPDERISVKSDEVKPKHGFKILEVNRVPGNPLGTTVRLSSGSSIGTVAFDEKLLTLSAAPAAKAHPQANPTIQSPQPNQIPQPAPSPLPLRQPRPRIVPPGTPMANPQGAVQPTLPGGYRPPGQSSPLNTRPDRRTHR